MRRVACRRNGTRQSRSNSWRSCGSVGESADHDAEIANSSRRMTAGAPEHVHRPRVHSHHLARTSPARRRTAGRVRAPVVSSLTRTQPRVAEGGGAVGSQPLVLVADDEPRITKLVSIALSEEGFRVVTAASGEEALKKAEAVRSESVPLDI